MDRIDTHVHVFAAVSDRYPREVTTLCPGGRSATIERLLRAMDGAAIDRAVLIQLGGCGIEHHRYFAEALRRWPGRFAGVGLVDAHSPDSATRLEELHRATGIKGLRLMGRLGNLDTRLVDELPALAVCRRAGELGLHVNLYCLSDQLGNIERLVGACPSVGFSLDHLGICRGTEAEVDAFSRPRFPQEPLPPTTYDRVLALARFSNVRIKVSGEYAFSKRVYPFSDIRPMVEAVYEAFGADRLMWGSDFPWIAQEPGYLRCAELIDYHLPCLRRDERDAILGGNAARMWFDE